MEVATAMNRWRVGMVLIGAVVVDMLEHVWRYLEPGLRVAGSCWCAGCATADMRWLTNHEGSAWYRTREAQIRWRAAAGLAQIDRLLDRQLEWPPDDLSHPLRWRHTDQEDDRP